MTWYEIGPVGEIERGPGGRDSWAAALVPLLSAALVLALGLVLVGLTSGGTADEPTPPAAIGGRQ